MRVTDYHTAEAQASLHPRGHNHRNTGPYSLRIGSRSQPPIVQDWTARYVLLNIEQPNDQDNTTLIRVMFLHHGRKKPSFVAGLKFSRARWYSRGTTIEVRMKKRVVSSIPHPVPLGRYSGHCMYREEDGVAVFTFQARSLVKTAEPKKPKTIVTPGDPEYDDSLARIKGIVHRVDGVDG